jgi:hypothetical protein
MIGRLFGAAALAAVMGISAPASATILDIQYTGTVGYSNSNDGLGLFGPAQESLAGDTFVATFVVNIGSITSSPVGPNIAEGVGLANPIVQWSVTVNGETTLHRGRMDRAKYPVPLTCNMHKERNINNL